GYLGGKVDSVMMRLLEILNSFPFMFFVILLVTFFGQNILLIFVAIEDQIGEILGAKVVILLVGERPGLGQSESLSCYAVYS
ncbi:ethanolamine ammonia-lyase light chain EutC, partial [Rhizobium johnstonii]|uniref:ethanolamine ammonia-lyase light chain EutC n=1 Tax=Rhizobium johnstonii TaxID=3019933 RepID=UPI003F98F0A4